MAREHDYFVYLLSNKTRTVLYIGVTNDLEARLRAHISRLQPKSFTARYQVDRLMYYEQFDDVYVAIAREKQLKGWTRAKKEVLIATLNPQWTDLSAGWEALRDVRKNPEGYRAAGRVYPAARSFGSLHSPQDDRRI